jgi:hypothetical protein
MAGAMRRIGAGAKLTATPRRSSVLPPLAPPLARLTPGLAVALTWWITVGVAAPARAGLLRPVLQLMRPQLEQRLARVCVDAAGGGDPSLERTLQDPCRKLAVPTSKCLIEETDNTGRGLGVLTELLAGRFGDDSEVVVKRCLARMFGLPADSLRQVPLRELGKRFQPGGEGESRGEQESRR